MEGMRGELELKGYEGLHRNLMQWKIPVMHEDDPNEVFK